MKTIKKLFGTEKRIKNGDLTNSRRQPLPIPPTSNDHPYMQQQQQQQQQQQRQQQVQHQQQQQLQGPRNDDHIKGLPYYHSNLNTSDEVETIMERFKLQNGYFLLTNDFTGFGHFLIFVTHQKATLQFKIKTSEYAYFISIGKEFRTIHSLVSHYSIADIPSNTTPGVRLTMPVKKAVERQSQVAAGPVRDSDEGQYLHLDTIEKRCSSMNTICQPASNISDEGYQPILAHSKLAPPQHYSSIQTATTYDVKNSPEKFSLEISSVRETDGKRESVIENNNDVIINNELNADVIENSCHIDDVEDDEDNNNNSNRNSYEIYSEVLEIEDIELPLGWKVRLSINGIETIQFVSPDGESFSDLPTRLFLSFSAELKEWYQKLISSDDLEHIVQIWNKAK